MARDPLSKVVEHLRGVLQRQDAAGKPDGDLLRRYVQERDQAAFEALVRRHGPMVLGVCRRVLHNQHDAEDAFQATFLVLVRKAALLRSPGMIGNWLYGVAYRTALHARGAAVKRRAKEAEVPERMQTTEDGWADLQPLLDKELERLADKYRVLVVLCDLQGRTRREVAGLLGLPEGTVASRLATARTILAKRLAGRGLVLTGGALAGTLSANAASAGMPLALCATTVKAASLYAAGQAAAAGAISVQAVTIAEGVLKTMLLSKLKMMTMVLMAVGLVTASGAGVAYHANGREQAGGMSGQSAKVLALAKGLQELPKDKKLPELQKPDPRLAELDALTKHLLDKEAQLAAALAKAEAELKQAQRQLALAHIELEQVRAAKAVDSKLSQNIFSLPELSDQDASQIVRIVRNTIEPNSWASLDPKKAGRSNGSVEWYSAGKSLVVTNTPEILEQVRTVLSRLTMNVKKEREKLDRDVQRVYPVADLGVNDGASLIKVITETLEPVSWATAGGLGTIAYFPEGKSLVVTQSPEIQGRVQSLLDELRKAKSDQEKK